MADAFTPNFNLTKPEVGASRDTWGAKENHNFDLLDAILAVMCPIGIMDDFAGTTAPPCWLLCDASLQLIADYPALYAKIGTRFGGDGVTTFGLPDSRGRVSVGVGTATDTLGVAGTFSLGQKIGYWQYTLTLGNLPYVAMTIGGDGGHDHPPYITDVQGWHGHAASTDVQGYHDHNIYAGFPVGAGSNFVQGSGRIGLTGGAMDVQGGHGHNVFISGDGLHAHNTWTPYGGYHSHSAILPGGGVAFPMYQPGLGVTKIIFAGFTPTVVPELAGALPTVLAQVLSSPWRGMH